MSRKIVMTETRSILGPTGSRATISNAAGSIIGRTESVSAKVALMNAKKLIDALPRERTVRGR